MTATELEYAEKRMRQKWYELVQAEHQGASMQALERLYSAYMLSIEDYNRCSANNPPTYEEQSLPTTTHLVQNTYSGHHKKRAS